MKDQVSINLLPQFHPAVRDKFEAFINEVEATYPVTVRLVEVLRTMAEQQKVYDQGRRTPGKIVTNAVPGSSYHQYGLAADLVPLKNGRPDYDHDQSPWAPIASKYGITWGGNFAGSFKDRDHWESQLGHNWRQWLAQWNAKRFIPGTPFVEIPA